MAKKIADERVSLGHLPGAPEGSVYSPLPDDTKEGVIKCHGVVTVNASAEELYALWNDAARAPQWVERLESARDLGNGRVHWVMRTGDKPNDVMEWKTQATEMLPGKRLVWETVPGSATSDYEETGVLTFERAAGDRGTVITLVQTFKIPGGRFGNAVMAFFARSPRQMLIEDLRHLKALAETGEIPRIDEDVHGPRGFSGSMKQRLYGENNPIPPETTKAA